MLKFEVSQDGKAIDHSSEEMRFFAGVEVVGGGDEKDECDFMRSFMHGKAEDETIAAALGSLVRHAAACSKDEVHFTAAFLNAFRK